MNKREENKKGEIDWKKVMYRLDWNLEISPVMLCKAVNQAMNFTKPKDKFNTGQRYFGDLVKKFESYLPQAVSIRQEGRDRFYRVVGYTPQELMNWVDSGVLQKQIEKKKQPEVVIETPEVTFDIPVEIKSEKTKVTRGKKVDYPDNEAYIKTLIVLGAFKELGSNIVPNGFTQKLREKAGFALQRNVDGKKHTLAQEVTKTLSMIDEGILSVTRRHITLLNEEASKEAWEGIISLLETDASGKVNCPDWVLSLGNGNITKEFSQGKEQEITSTPIKEEEVSPKEEEKTPEVIVVPIEKANRVEKKYSLESFREHVKRGERRQYSPDNKPEPVGKRWKKGLIIEAVSEGRKEVSNIILHMKQRYCEIDQREVQDLLIELNRQFGGNILSEDCKKEYNLKSIKEVLFVRLHMTEEELRETYPALGVRLFSESTIPNVVDNVFELSVDRTEQAEENAAALRLRMRKGEGFIVPAKGTWITSRIHYIIEQWGFEDMLVH